MFNSTYFYQCDVNDILGLISRVGRVQTISDKKILVKEVCDRFVGPGLGPTRSAWDNFPKIMQCLQNFLEWMGDTGMSFETFDKYSALMSLYWTLKDSVGEPGLWGVRRNLDDEFRHAIDYDSDTPTIDMDSDSDTVVEAYSDTDSD